MSIKASNQSNRLYVCQKVRQIAAQTCLYSLQKIWQKKDKVSEVKFRNIWLEELYKSKDIIGEGWYDPPPYGIGVLFGDEKDYDRVNYSTLRPKFYWPKQNVYLNKSGLGYIFASPFAFIDDVPIIGDFGFTYYLGLNKKIIEHFKKCHNILEESIDMITIGMEYRQIYTKTIELMERNNLRNNIISTTDNTGTDVGHCIPFIDRDPNQDEEKKFKSGDDNAIHQAINRARRFINNKEAFAITDNCAFTFEPRFISVKDEFLPMFSFHTIVEFINGRRIVLSNMRGIIDLLGMSWLKS